LSLSNRTSNATVSTLRLRGRASPLTVQDVVSSGEHTLVLSGALDVSSRPMLDEVLRRVIGAGSAAVALDMRRVAFVDSSGLDAMLDARALCRQRGCALRVVGGQPQVGRLFGLADVVDELSLRTHAEAQRRS
jgi:anti-sigma B factor antagonist